MSETRHPSWGYLQLAVVGGSRRAFDATIEFVLRRAQLHNDGGRGYLPAPGSAPPIVAFSVNFDEFLRALIGRTPNLNTGCTSHLFAYVDQVDKEHIKRRVAPHDDLATTIGDTTSVLQRLLGSEVDAVESGLAAMRDNLDAPKRHPMLAAFKTLSAAATKLREFGSAHVQRRVTELVRSLSPLMQQHLHDTYTEQAMDSASSRALQRAATVEKQAATIYHLLASWVGRGGRAKDDPASVGSFDDGAYAVLLSATLLSRDGGAMATVMLVHEDGATCVNVTAGSGTRAWETACDLPTEWLDIRGDKIVATDLSTENVLQELRILAGY